MLFPIRFENLKRTLLIALAVLAPLCSIAAPASASRCEEFLKELTRFNEGHAQNNSEDLAEAWALVRNESLQPLARYYGSLRANFKKHDCDVNAKFMRHWRLFVYGHLNAPDALEPRNLSYTNRLISLAFRTGNSRIVSEIIDVYASYILANPDWANAVVRSPQLSSVLMERLSLLSAVPWDYRLKAEAIATISRRSSRLLPLYRQLAAATSTDQFLRIIPSGAHAKPEYVHQAVRSALTHFLNMKPSTEQIRQLALWMHDFKDLFFIQDQALRHVRSASEFLRITAYSYEPVSPEYRLLVREFLIPKYEAFRGLEPSGDEINQFRARIETASLDAPVLASAFDEAKTAAEFVKVAQSVNTSDSKKSTELSDLLRERVQSFAQLEPSAEQLNAFRLLLGAGESDLKLLRYSLPKMASAADFLSVARLFGKDFERKGDVHSLGVRKILAEYLDTFVALSPTVDEINGYRARVLEPQSDRLLLKLGMERARSSREILLLAALYGREPQYSPTIYDEIIAASMVANVDKFLKYQPSQAEVEIYRARMANPQADLKLVSYALSRASNRAEVFSIIGRRPMLHAPEYERAWSQTLAGQIVRVKVLLSSNNDRELFLREVPDRAISNRLRASF